MEYEIWFDPTLSGPQYLAAIFPPQWNAERQQYEFLRRKYTLDAALNLADKHLKWAWQHEQMYTKGYARGRGSVVPWVAENPISSPALMLGSVLVGFLGGLLAATLAAPKTPTAPALPPGA